MKIGMICKPEDAKICADAGFDYFECNIGSTLHPDQPEETAGDYRSLLTNAALPCPAGCCLFPGKMKVTGPDADPAAIAAYIENAVRRAAVCGVNTLVFGSGASRSCPEGFPMEEAAKQIESLLRNALPVLERCGVTLVLEPLCTQQSNLLNTVASAAILVQKFNHPNLRLLADSYHFIQSDNMLDALTWALPLIEHVHVATGKNRRAPGMEPDEGNGLRDFLAVLKHGGYAGRFTVECICKEPLADEIRRTTAYLHDLWDSIR